MSESNNKNKLKALVVEDNILTQRLVGIFLEKLGFDSVMLENGQEAIKEVKETKFDIIFLDIMMPKLDGYETCKIIKTDKNSKDIPVIMLTSNDGFFDKIKGKRAGTDVYLTKPVKYDEIVETIKKFFPDVKEQEDRH